MIRDDLRCIYHIAAKDMRTYYLKPPAVSWGMVFPAAWTLAFYLRSPSNFDDLIPGLIAMTILQHDGGRGGGHKLRAEARLPGEAAIGAGERGIRPPGKGYGRLLLRPIDDIDGDAGNGSGPGPPSGPPRPDPVGLISLLVFSSMGALFSVLFKEVFEAQTFLNLPRFLMVFLCGVVYPISAMPWWLQQTSQLSP